MGILILLTYLVFLAVSNKPLVATKSKKTKSFLVYDEPPLSSNNSGYINAPDRSKAMFNFYQ